MNDKYYGIYFDPSELEVDRKGHLLNVDVLHIIEFEYADDESDAPTAIRRVAKDGSLLEVKPDLRGLSNIGYDDFRSIEETLGWFYIWLSENLEWRESSPETYYQPAEYICIGITGYCDDENEYWHPARRFRRKFF